MAQSLTAERARELLRYNKRTGVLTWRVDVLCGRYYKQFAARAGQRAGSANEGRIQIRVDGKNYRAHRVIWLIVTGAWPIFEVDHKDTDGTNNRWRNLRPATRRINNQNRRRANPGNRTKLLGVSQRSPMCFIAQISIDRRTKYLGSFSSAQAAHSAYLQAKRKYHEGCLI